MKNGRSDWRLSEQQFPSEAWRVKLSSRLTTAAVPQASSAEGSGLPDLPRSRALQRYGVQPEQEAAFLSWSAAQRAARRSSGNPDELEGEDSD